MINIWLDFGQVLVETFILANFLLKNRMCFSKNTICAISQEWLVRLMWNKKEVHQLVTGYNMWPWPLTSLMTLTLDASRSNSPCGCGDLSVRLGSRISPHRHRVVVEVHWRDAQGWRSFSWVVATFNHVGGSFNLSMAATGDVWIIPSFRIWGYVLYVEPISCVITNCGQLQWAIPSLFSIAL